MHKQAHAKTQRRRQAAAPAAQSAPAPAPNHLWQHLHHLELEVQTLHATHGGPPHIPWWARDWDATPTDRPA